MKMNNLVIMLLSLLVLFCAKQLRAQESGSIVGWGSQVVVEEGE